MDKREELTPREHHPCTSCGGPMLIVQSEENDVVRWKRCGGCGLFQEGEMR